MLQFAKRCFATVVFGVGGMPMLLAAQQIHGTVLNSDAATPASSAVILLLHATKDSILARTVSGARGVYTLKTTTVGPARLRVLRIGYQPQNVGTYRLTMGEVLDVPITLVDERVQVVAFDVSAKNQCQLRPSGAQRVSQLFEQARTALLASASSVTGEQNEAWFTNFVRTEDKRGNLIGPVQRSTTTGPSARAFGSLPPDSLAKVGYIVGQRDGSMMYAPDAEVLISDTFLGRHCLMLAEGKGADTSLVGIAFRPTRSRVAYVDVKGTLWLDRNTLELQYLDYTYEPLSAEFQNAGVGGHVEYAQTASGMWFVKAWSIRMPRVEATTFLSVRYNGLQTTGGEVQGIRADENLLYSNSAAMRAGSKPDDPASMQVTAGLQKDIPSDQTDSAKTDHAARALAESRLEHQHEMVNAAIDAAEEARVVPVLPTDKKLAALYVVDAAGRAISYATVILNGGVSRVTDSTGRVILPTGDQNSISVDVRRMGYDAFNGNAARTTAAEAFRVSLSGSTQPLNGVNVRSRAKTPLEQNGFYERMIDSQRGATRGEFLTPEMLEQLPGTLASHMFNRTRYVHASDGGPNAILLGANGCRMAIVVDGHRISSMSGLQIDQLVQGAAINAIEIYPSRSSAPPGLVPLEDDKQILPCGIVAIWTGPRR